MTKRKTTVQGAAARARKRNPNDATFRNITALKKRVTRLEDALGLLMGLTEVLADTVAKGFARSALPAPVQKARKRGK